MQSKYAIVCYDVYEVWGNHENNLPAIAVIGGLVTPEQINAIKQTAVQVLAVSPGIPQDTALKLAQHFFVRID